ncbi:MAG: hypothetical protein ACREOC_09325 [Gemmatimonadales bacterium]
MPWGLDETLDFDRGADSLTTLGTITTKRCVERAPPPERRHQRASRSCSSPARAVVGGGHGGGLDEDLQNATALLVVQFSRGSRTCSSCYLAVRDAAVRARTWFPASLTCFTPPEAQDGDLVSVYLWNNGEAVCVDDLRMRWTRAVY